MRTLAGSSLEKGSEGVLQKNILRGVWRNDSRQFFSCDCWSLLIAVTLSLTLGGCGTSSQPESVRNQPRSPSPLKSETTVVGRSIKKEKVEPVQPPQPTVPTVHLSEQHQAASLVKQGDFLPDMRLADPEGKTHSLHSLLGDRVTVVCFWSGESPAAVQQLQDTGPEIVEPFKEQGLAVVSINYGQSAAEIRKVTAETDFAEKVLMDPRGEGLGQVATRYLPRTYLVDPEGKIVWFDMEYSPSTRRHLRQAIECSMQVP